MAALMYYRKKRDGLKAALKVLACVAGVIYVAPHPANSMSTAPLELGRSFNVGKLLLPQNPETGCSRRVIPALVASEGDSDWMAPITSKSLTAPNWSRSSLPWNSGHTSLQILRSRPGPFPGWPAKMLMNRPTATMVS